MCCEFDYIKVRCPNWRCGKVFYTQSHADYDACMRIFNIDDPNIPKAILGDLADNGARCPVCQCEFMPIKLDITVKSGETIQI